MRQLETVHSAIPLHTSKVTSHRTPPAWVVPSVSGCSYGRFSSPGWTTARFSVGFHAPFTPTAITQVPQEVDEQLEHEGWKHEPSVSGGLTWGDWTKRLPDGKLATVRLSGAVGGHTLDRLDPSLWPAFEAEQGVVWGLDAIAPPVGHAMQCTGGG
jgi:hypothetical protein